MCKLIVSLYFVADIFVADMVLVDMVVADIDFLCGRYGFLLWQISSCCGRYGCGRYGLWPIWSHSMHDARPSLCYLCGLVCGLVVLRNSSRTRRVRSRYMRDARPSLFIFAVLSAVLRSGFRDTAAGVVIGCEPLKCN